MMFLHITRDEPTDRERNKKKSKQSFSTTPHGIGTPVRDDDKNVQRDVKGIAVV
jgi:hypothetical protein